MKYKGFPPLASLVGISKWEVQSPFTMTCKTILNVRFTLYGPNLGKLRWKINVETHKRVKSDFCFLLSVQQVVWRRRLPAQTS
jgi:hypothetical protein